MTLLTSQDLFNALQGDLQTFSLLVKESHKDIVAYSMARTPSQLTVTTAAVRKVLLALLKGEAAPELVQRWASFVRWGFFVNPSSTERVRPLYIEYDPQFEDEIVEVIGRLDEIGDLIDGEVGPDEIRAMLRTLPEPRQGVE